MKPEPPPGLRSKTGCRAERNDSATSSENSGSAQSSRRAYRPRAKIESSRNRRRGRAQRSPRVDQHLRQRFEQANYFCVLVFAGLDELIIQLHGFERLDEDRLARCAGRRAPLPARSAAPPRARESRSRPFPGTPSTAPGAARGPGECGRTLLEWFRAPGPANALQLRRGVVGNLAVGGKNRLANRAATGAKSAIAPARAASSGDLAADAWKSCRSHWPRPPARCIFSNSAAASTTSGASSFASHPSGWKRAKSQTASHPEIRDAFRNQRKFRGELSSIRRECRAPRRRAAQRARRFAPHQLAQPVELEGRLAQCATRNDQL